EPLELTEDATAEATDVDAEAPDLDHDSPDLDHDSPGVADGSTDLTNGDLARIFHEIGDMLELKGELVFKTVAYHRAADAIGRSPVDAVSANPSASPPETPA